MHTKGNGQMILKREIEMALDIQSRSLRLKSGIIQRSILNGFKPTAKHIEVISGIRRCGKSTLMKQIIHQTEQQASYFSFEDTRVHGFEVSDFPKLEEVMGDDIEVYFFDEVQNVPSWEIFVRQLHDRQAKVFITGSNATLLSKELGTRLTGRHVRHELFPFSYDEFLLYRNLQPGPDSFYMYIKLGGFPEFLETENPEILQNLMKDIVLRDIAIRYGIRNTGSIMDITLYLLSNIGKEFSYNNLRKVLSFGSTNTVADYLTWLSESYLLFFLPRFSWSAKNILVNPRKVYAIDNGLIQSNTLSFNEDKGRLLENAVYLFLRRHKLELFYFRETHECDFVVFKDRKCQFLIQVCQSLTNDNLKRELDGLKEAMNFFKLNTGYVLTLDQLDTFQLQDGLVNVMPVYQFITSYSHP